MRVTRFFQSGVSIDPILNASRAARKATWSLPCCRTIADSVTVVSKAWYAFRPDI